MISTRGAGAATTGRDWASAGIDRLRGAPLDYEEVVGGVDVEAERPIELDVACPGVRGARRMRPPAVAAETELDRVGWRDEQHVRSPAVAVRDEDDERSRRVVEGGQHGLECLG